MIFYSADPHLNFQIPPHVTDGDILIVAGDFLNERSELMLHEQLSLMLTYIQHLQAEPCKLILSSGNHDCAEVPLLVPAAYHTEEFKYLRALEGHSNYFNHFRIKDKVFVDEDIMVCNNNKCIIQVLPYLCSEDAQQATFDGLLRQGQRVKNKHEDYTWIVVSHQPPSPCPIARRKNTTTQLGSECLFNLLYDYYPDIMISGHIHSPEKNECLVNKTRCIHANPEFALLET